MLAAATSASAQIRIDAQIRVNTRTGPAWSEGYVRGHRAGEHDARRGERFSIVDEGDYRRADAGYRPYYGHPDFYRREFRSGFEQGYRTGYQIGSRAWSGRGYGPPWADGRGPYPNRPGRGVFRDDPARHLGFTDGYEAGFDDGRDGRRFDPVAERRYRSGDRGYEREYGPRDLWAVRYRDGFRDGYERGYNDGMRPAWRW
jgi:hypothetical protein